MNDPHVVALNYCINYGDTIDYSRAKCLELDNSGFRLTVEDKKARFELKEHYATEEQARAALADYIHVWEFDATLRYGNPDSFGLEFGKAEIINRNPTPREFNSRATATVGPQVIFTTVRHSTQFRH